MRLRLVLSFVLIVLVSVASVTLIASQGVAREVRVLPNQRGQDRSEEQARALAHGSITMARLVSGRAGRAE